MRRFSAFVILLVLVCAHGAWAAEGEALAVGVATNAMVELNDGTQFRLLRMMRREGDAVTFKHASGISTVNYSEMTAASRALFGAPPSATNVPSEIPAAPMPGSDFLPAAVPKAAPVAATVCAVCRGSHTVVCPTCRGMKFADDQIVGKLCTECNGTRFVSRTTTYTYPGGPGAKNKVHSHTARETCPTCGGNGKMQVNARGYCETCKGTGVAKCPACSR